MPSTVTDLPFNKHIGVQLASTDDGLLELPAGGQYLNHLGTVHASAQFALAEASSGEFLLRSFGADSGLIAVVRRAEVKFRKPGTGTITSVVTTPIDAIESAVNAIAKSGRCLFNVSVELHDETGSRILMATFEWFLAHANKS